MTATCSNLSWPDAVVLLVTVVSIFALFITLALTKSLERRASRTGTRR